MSDLVLRRTRRRTVSVPVLLGIVALTVLAVVAATALYLRIGWWKMESACSLDDAQGQVHRSVAYGWSWQPPGFQCTYDHGQTETSLWF